MTITNCKELVDLFYKVGGEFRCNYLERKCELTPPELVKQLVKNRVINTDQYNKLECKLSHNPNNNVEIGMLLFTLGTHYNLNKMIKYDYCKQQKTGDFMRHNYHHYQEVNTNGFTINMDVAKM